MASLQKVEMLHSRYYADLLARADQMFQSGRDSAKDGSALFLAELDNFKTGQSAAEHLTSVNITATRLVCAYPMNGANLINLYFPPAEQIKWNEMALQAARNLQDQRAEAVILSNLGMAYEATGHLRRALDCQKKSLRLAKAVGDRFTEETTLGNLGAAYQMSNQFRRAIDCYAGQRIIAEEIGDTRGAANALMNAGNCYFYLGENAAGTEPV